MPAGLVYHVLQMQADRQLQSPAMVIEVGTATLGPVRTLGLPVEFSDTHGKVRTGPSAYGLHRRKILGAYRFSDAEMAALLAEAATGVHYSPGLGAWSAARPG